jgi:hypothetical protein
VHTNVKIRKREKRLSGVIRIKAGAVSIERMTTAQNDLIARVFHIRNPNILSLTLTSYRENCNDYIVLFNVCFIMQLWLKITLHKQ